jgi:RNA polymerase sigma-70 factor, ECF subfamily
MSIALYNACEDSKASIALLFKQYRPRLIVFARAFVKDTVFAEDIVSDVFLKFLLKGNMQECEAAKKIFLYRCTRNECIDYLRGKKFRDKQLRKVSDNDNEHEGFALNYMERQEQIIRVRNIIETLPPICKRVITLSYIKGLNRQEIAHILNISANTVRNHKRQGLIWIKERFFFSSEATHNKPLNGKVEAMCKVKIAI